MYLEHYGLTEPPFRITPHTDFFFSGANRGATLEALIYAITHDEGIVKISGEVGSGKTMLCRVLMERLPENVVIIYLANPSLSREDILYALADELGIAIPENSRTSMVLRALQEKLVGLYAAGKQVVVLIDEAHAMPMETLEEIRLLSNLESNRHKLLQLVLFGQPELNETLARSDMRQLRERITHNFSLEPLVRDDVNAYLDFRMRAAGYRGPNVFAPAAVKLIADASQGLTRRINILADKSLLASFAAGSHQVGPKEARAAIRDSEFSGTRSYAALTPGRGLLWAAGGAIAALVAVAGGFFFASTNQSEAPATANQPITGTIAPQPAAAAVPLTPDNAAQTPPLPPAQASTKPLEPLVVKKEIQTPLLDSLLEQSRPWLRSVADDRWFIQLYRTADSEHPEDVEYFLQKAKDAGMAMGQVRVYHAVVREISRYGVVYGDFASRKAAASAINALPPEIRRYHPYARQAIRLKPDDSTKLK